MDYKELHEKYQELITENKNLRAEIAMLKAESGILEKPLLNPQSPSSEIKLPLQTATHVSGTDNLHAGLSYFANSSDKITFFMSLFKGRDDVYAQRWQNKDGRFGYTPCCLNEWKKGLCRKPLVKCSECEEKSFDGLNQKVIEAHLRGNTVVGIYPLLQDETCYFLAIDFDDKGWQKDVSSLRDTCLAFDIPVAIERSRSGNGAHAWFFFQNRIPAPLVRKFGSALLTYSMSKRHEISFKSYDRFFPNQDTMPKGGLGNLIALPLQKKARDQGNSVFVDENFKQYDDQWCFLRTLGKLSEEDLFSLLPKLCHGNELGALLEIDEENEVEKPKAIKNITLSKRDFPVEIKLIKANMIFISKSGISQKALNTLKRLAAFKNPEFYKAQAMRMPTYNKPRIISCAEETNDYLCLPRGCETDTSNVLGRAGVKVIWSEKTNSGRRIHVEFKGTLREEQQPAANAMLKHESGVLSATTAFGKTVIAARLIAEKKVNTLILVHRQQLLTQWATKIAEFLEINEEIPVLEKKRGRKKQQNLIGLVGAGKNNPSGIIDIAVMQSLNHGGEVKEIVKNYGMIIVDECHHVPAFSFEQILKSVSAKYVYGLTATPTRKDGHQPIIFMHCGPIRYRVDAKKQAENRPFEHYVIPRFTSFRALLENDGKEISIQELYSEIAVNELRNELIADDVMKSWQNGRNSLVLTERTAHVELLAKKLKEKIPDVITLTGGVGAKEKRETLSRILQTPSDKQLTLIATGKYIGEGFDEPRLDTLFLAMPISWKGTLQQYAGRLHRLLESKSEVQIYDYIDVHVKMLGKMYNKRLAGYAAIGYKTKAESLAEASVDIIFDNQNFLPMYSHDLINAKREAVIVSPFISRRRLLQMLTLMNTALGNKVKVVVLTRPATDYKDKQSIEETLSMLQIDGITVIYKSNIHQKFAIFDQKIVWYGSINLLSFGRAQESIMRLENLNIANELIRAIGK